VILGSFVACFLFAIFLMSFSVWSDLFMCNEFLNAF
jgi:hypothetical protein